MWTLCVRARDPTWLLLHTYAECYCIKDCAVLCRAVSCACLCCAGAVDKKQHEVDADRMFDWEDVLLVDMRSSTPVQCPISLDSPPVCPQITPCGHVFSFGSIMRHLMTHGGEQLRRSAPCPLCYQPLVARELRLVQVGGVLVQVVGGWVV